VRSESWRLDILARMTRSHRTRTRTRRVLWCCTLCSWSSLRMTEVLDGRKSDEFSKRSNSKIIRFADFWITMMHARSLVNLSCFPRDDSPILEMKGIHRTHVLDHIGISAHHTIWQSKIDLMISWCHDIIGIPIGMILAKHYFIISSLGSSSRQARSWAFRIPLK
jgi:hypothetical protein